MGVKGRNAERERRVCVGGVGEIGEGVTRGREKGIKA